MGLNEDRNGKRIRNANTTLGCVMAPFYAVRKDHKTVEIGKEAEGPKTRGVCGAEDCLTMRLSHLLSLILKELIPQNETHCDSTEDLLAEIEKVNTTGNVKPRWKVGSLDIEALYPSLDIEKCAKIITKELYEGEIMIENVEWKEVMLYLRYMLDDDELTAKDLWEYVPKRRTNRGRPPTFISSGSDLHEEERLKSWVFPELEPDENIKKKMFADAIGVLIIKTISNHVYQYNSTIFKQVEGGAIGLELVGIIANIYMAWWDKELIQLITNENMEVEVYKRYVDDINVVIDDFDENSDDERVIRKISELADTIDPSIRSTYDYGKNYSDSRLPMLDLKLWIGTDISNQWRILHTHYMKDVSSRYLIHERSSHPSKMKYNVLVNEGLRILRNTSIHLDWEESRQHLQYFVHRMQFSGYDQARRTNVIQKVLRKWDEKMRKYEITNKMYQSRKEQYDERRKVKEAKQNNWYDREKYDGVMFVDVTENGEMLNEVKKVVKRNKMKIKVVEKMRSTLKTQIQRSNPFKRTTCGREECALCINGSKVDCRTRGCVYEIKCIECSRKYIGQTGRSLYERVNEHYKGLNERKDKAVLWEHSKIFHNEETVRFEVRIKSKCFGEPTRRMISEAVLINELSDDETLNSRHEWTYVKLPRASIV